MKQSLDPRHNARKLALGALFCRYFYHEVFKNIADASIATENVLEDEECLNLSREMLDFKEEELDIDLAIELTVGVRNNQDSIDAIIVKHAPDWPIDKISKVDLIILRISIFEVAFGQSVPVKVAIDEAVELAKEFGGDTSSKFVNGVLGAVATEKSAGNTASSE